MADRVDPALNRTITWIAVVIAIFTALFVPGLYYYTAYDYESGRIRAVAENAADGLSEIVFSNPRMWSFMADRLTGQLTELDRGQRRVYIVSDTEGVVVLDQGEDVDAPSVTATAELSDGFRAVGTIQVVENVRHIWIRTGFAALVGVALGLAMFAALRVLPLRALGHAMRGLQEAHTEITKLNLGLEQKVEKRTAELRATQVELLGKERLAAIGQVTATVGHELRNPLGAIRSALAVVRKLARDEDPMMKESLDISDRGIIRCDAVISDLLDFTRIRQLNREPTAIDDWLRTVLDEYDLPAPIRLRLGPEGGIEMPVDRDRLRRVVVNVIDNACHAMDANEPAGNRAPLLTVGARVNGERLEIAVRDTGRGMVPEVAAKAFEPLYSTKAFGVGLGLPMVKKVMEQHGGGVELTSQEERGTEVVLWLPLAAEARGDAA